MPSVRELYGELWAEEHSPLDRELRRSLDPRGTASLYDAFAQFPIGADDLILDAGARDAAHAIELVRRFGCRAVAVDPIALHVERARARIAAADCAQKIDVVEAALESLPFESGAFDYVWCRDVLNHVELPTALRELARVLRPAGRMLVYQTFATDACEPGEARRLFAASASRADSMSSEYFEQTATRAGFAIARSEPLYGEWRERMLEDGSWDVAADALALSRLNRREAALTESYGHDAVEATWGNLVWGIYQLLGKTCPTIYVLDRHA
jgi:SAM-dependent methyltransferase